jgi:hypothetical protein
MESMANIIPDRLTMQNIERQNIETCHLAGGVARMMNTFQQGMLTLQRVRTGGEQRVVVEQHQYVTRVEDGGQAVIGPKVRTRGGGRNGGGGSQNVRSTSSSLMEIGSCSRRCMPSLRSKATQRWRNVQGSGHGEWALSAAWRQKHRAAHAGRARTVATGSPRACLLHGGSESRTGRGASHNARASMAPAGSQVGVTGFSLTSPADNLVTVTGAPPAPP